MSDRLRVGVVGLGHMGRHHVRIVSRLDGVLLVGGADPAGDSHNSLGQHPLFPSLESLLEEGLDAVILATPPSSHEKSALLLAEAGVHALIEKPLASDLEGALAIRDAFADLDVVAAVGHVERFNPALREMKLWLEERRLGQIFVVKTTRTGPLPARDQEIGVVHDLASHDIDIVHWLFGGFQSLRALQARYVSPLREDLLEAVGRLDDGSIVSMSVNWLSPAKERTVSVLGEGGALVADLLTSDLTFYSNSAMPNDWEEMAQLKGVATGDVTRFAIHKAEPLQLELEAFVDAAHGGPGAQMATLGDGVRVMEVAEAILDGGLGL